MSIGDHNYYVHTGNYSTAAGSITIDDNNNGQTIWVQPQYDTAGNLPEHSHGGAWTYDIGLEDKEKIEKLEKTIEMMWKLLKMEMDGVSSPRYKGRKQEIEVLDKLIHPDRYPKEKELVKGHYELTEKEEVHLEEDLFQI